jgi:hypothetical protein
MEGVITLVLHRPVRSHCVEKRQQNMDMDLWITRQLLHTQISLNIMLHPPHTVTVTRHIYAYAFLIYLHHYITYYG